MDLIQMIILITIAISGTVFGSFFTLAVHRIPRKEDITHERSYCPKCNHKLQFLDLIPVFSYIFLGGKCRYCKDKIRPRYLIFEIFSGLVFLCLGLSYGVNIFTPAVEWINFILLVLFLCCTFIVAGIDKETYTIPNGVIIYGLIIGIFKVIYKAWCGMNIMSNIIGFVFIPVILWLSNLLAKKIPAVKEIPFGGGDIKYVAVLGLFLGLVGQIIAIHISCILILIHQILKLIRKNNDNNKIAWGFFLSIAANLFLICLPQFSEWINIMEMVLIG